jgi:hypothetical protein
VATEEEAVCGGHPREALFSDTLKILFSSPVWLSAM